MWALGIVWAVVGGYDLFVAQVLNRQAQEEWPRISDVLGWWDWWVWVIGLLFSLWLLTLEGSYHTIRPLQAKQGVHRQLRELDRLFAEGVVVRNAVPSHTAVPDMLWLEKVQSWRMAVRDVLEHLGPAEHALFETLNLVEPVWIHESERVRNDPPTETERHLAFLNKELQIVEEIFRRHLAKP